MFNLLAKFVVAMNRSHCCSDRVTMDEDSVATKCINIVPIRTHIQHCSDDAHSKLPVKVCVPARVVFAMCMQWPIQKFLERGRIYSVSDWWLFIANAHSNEL